MGKKPNQNQVEFSSMTMDAQMVANEEWYTINDIMQHFNISRSSVYRLRNNKQLPAHKLGGIIVFPKSLINKLLMDKALCQVISNNNV